MTDAAMADHEKRKSMNGTGQRIDMPFIVHDPAGLHALARSLRGASGCSEILLDCEFGTADAPDLRACIREVLQCSGLGITFSHAVERMFETTTILYDYRDASGYRKSAGWTVNGIADEEQIAEITGDHHEGFFVPLAVGIPMLSTGGPDADEDDHALHTVTGIRIGEGPSDDDRSIEELVQAFRTADWTEAMVRHSEGSKA